MVTTVHRLGFDPDIDIVCPDARPTQEDADYAMSAQRYHRRTNLPIVARFDTLQSINQFPSHACILGQGERSN